VNAAAENKILEKEIKTMNAMMKRFTVRGLLAAAFTISLAMPSLAASAGNNNAPGTVTTWGEGTYKPIPVVFQRGELPISISAYEYAGGLAITEAGRLYSWFGVTNAAPAQVTFPLAVTQVIAASRRWAHTLALINDGLYAWGQNDKGQLGDGTPMGGFHYDNPARILFPPSVTSVTAIAAGYLHSPGGHQ
jgi:hypothetical protein